jgi:hypothetical protein
MMVIRKDGYVIYCNPRIRPKVVRAAAKDPSFTLICRKPNEYGNTDDDERYKIESFIGMVDCHPEMAVPVGVKVDDDAKPPAELNVELWPIVQAYGLTHEFNTKGFYSMSHKVVPWPVSQLLARVDYYSARHVLVTAVPDLARHVESVARTLDLSTDESRARLSEAALGEPIITYYTYGAMGVADELQGRADAYCARLLYPAQCGAGEYPRSSVDAVLAPGDTHVVLEARDALSNIVAYRTFFPAGPKCFRYADHARSLLTPPMRIETLVLMDQADIDAKQVRGKVLVAPPQRRFCVCV